MAKHLRNIFNKKQCLERLAEEKFSRTTISFYKYVEIEDPKAMRDRLYLVWESIGVLGRIYVSTEGINAQLNVPEHHVDVFRASVDLIPQFTGVPFKFALEEPDLSFWKLTIKVRKHIVAHGIREQLDMSQVGTHLSAKEWHQAIESGAIVVDMRNAYESDIGHFEGAIRPAADTFREEIPQVLDMLQGKEDQKVLLYCTGGVRCEPFSALLKKKGFQDVNQLDGGIIQYAQEIKKKKLPSKFIGRNYVFDGRYAETVTPDVLGKCFNCQAPADTHVDCRSDLCHALFLQCADCQAKFEKTCSTECQAFAALPEEKRRELRKGRKAKFLIHRPASDKQTA